MALVSHVETKRFPLGRFSKMESEFSEFGALSDDEMAVLSLEQTETARSHAQLLQNESSSSRASSTCVRVPLPLSSGASSNSGPFGLLRSLSHGSLSLSGFPPPPPPQPQPLRPQTPESARPPTPVFSVGRTHTRGGDGVQHRVHDDCWYAQRRKGAISGSLWCVVPELKGATMVKINEYKNAHSKDYEFYWVCRRCTRIKRNCTCSRLVARPSSMHRSVGPQVALAATASLGTPSRELLDYSLLVRQCINARDTQLFLVRMLAMKLSADYQ